MPAAKASLDADAKNAVLRLPQLLDASTLRSIDLQSSSWEGFSIVLRRN